FTGTNPVLKSHLKATDHMFIVSRDDAGGPLRAVWHGSSDVLVKARVGDTWYKLNRPPVPASEETGQ
ncbi:MAG: hypothetical protein K2R98_15615, partial [Gemmataceae bacterium]|nr:hypothetical protein [Gemmataceae bacterium]